MPLSYAQYAGNGSTTTFSVPFPYLLKAHVKLYTGFSILSGTYTSLLVDGTDYTWTSSTQVQLSVAPANGVTLTVLRDTPDSSQLVPWQDGSNLIAEDLNIADLQNLYVVQEQQDRNDAGITQSTAAAAAATAATTAANTATSTANAATSTANTALSTANTALSTANTASTNASAAVSTANTASSNASAAVTTANTASATANTASTNASNAVTTANAASAAAASATTTANTAASNASTALSTANTASSNAAAAVSTANTASTNASNAVSTANTASSNASTALSTANTASTNASNAVTTANTANTKADQAIAAVSSSINYTLVANVAAIPGSPANNTYIEIADSTGLESFTPLTGVPAGYVGDSGLTARLKYTTTGSTWQWLNYYANDSDARFLKKSGGTMTGQLKGDDSASAATPGYAFDGDPNTGMGRPGADELALITGGTARLTIDPAGAVAVAGALSQGGNAVVVTTDSRLSDTRTPTDGSVTNAKVAAGAAIDKTKISGTAITAADTGTVTNAMLAGSIDKTKVSGTAITAADTGTVTSTMIADGTIVNADINASAAIDGTKINANFGSNATVTTGSSFAGSFIPTSSTAPTNGVYLPAANSVAISTSGSGRLFVDSSGRALIGTSSARSTGAIKILQIEGTDSTGPGAQFICNQNGSAEAAAITLAKSRSTSIGSNTIVQNGDTLGYITFNGADGSDLDSYAAWIKCEVDGTPGTNSMPGRIVLSTTSSGSSSPTERLRVDSSGNVNVDSGTFYVDAVNNRVSIGSTSPGSFNGDLNTLVVGSGSGNQGMTIFAGTASTSNISFHDTANTSLSGMIRYDHSNDAMSFWTNGVNERARIDSSGRLLIGTSTSLGKFYNSGSGVDHSFQIETTGAYAQSWVSHGTSAGFGAHLTIGRSRGTSAGSVTVVQADDSLGHFSFQGADGTEFVEAAKIQAFVDGTPGANDMPGRLVFSTTADGASSPTERMRITNGGYTKINCTTDLYSGFPFRLEVDGSANDVILAKTSSSGAVPLGAFNAATSGNNLFVYFYTEASPTPRGGIDYNRAAGQVRYNVTSDRRLKSDIEDAGSALSVLNLIKVRSYTWTETGYGVEYGFIAQELNETVPDAVKVGDDGDKVVDTWAVDNAKLVPVLTKALQEALQKIEAIEARLTALETA